MCGIFGYVGIGGVGNNAPQLTGILEKLFKLSETRGKEAAGLALLSGKTIGIYKDATKASEMLRSKNYKSFLNRTLVTCKPNDVVAAIGHTRLATHGVQVVDANNQPVERGGTILVHNGIIVNHADLWTSHPDLSARTQLDSEVAAALVEHYRTTGHDLVSAIQATMQGIVGETSLGMLFADMNVMALTTNTGSLFFVKDDVGEQLSFVSENFIARSINGGSDGLPGFGACEIQQVRAGQICLVDLEDLSISLFEIEGPPPQPSQIAPRLGFIRTVEEKARRMEAFRQEMKRCMRCLLPETMPFIEFNNEGVCNYCQSYKPTELLGRDALKEELSKFKPETEHSPNCILSFSGGRDSCYGLHIVMEELGVRPLAYTYDWGMVTDLGRRNQARMCGKLGVEHIWVSADIRAKRANIKRNVTAWLNKPDLGMIPLFMVGDKQFYYYARVVGKQTGIQNILSCSNPLERTDFKSAFSGAYPEILKRREKAKGSANMRGLDSFNAKLLLYYARQMLTNPSYLNRSLPDTGFAYASYYLMKRPFLNIFNYLPWVEDDVNDTLINEYDWEVAADSPSTWRIGDGTAPFYNYIYHHVAGFTEFDTFRSNQIREGHITREEAVEKVKEENQPRWDSMHEYCQTINIDFEDCLKKINSMPRLYAQD